MKKLVLSLLCLYCACSLSAQLNASLISNLDFEDTVNDIWGYVAPDGTEYAIVGLNGSIATVSLADPANPVLIDTVTLPNVTWRDMKTYGEYAYATADGRNASGITVLDYTSLPDTVYSTTYTYEVPGATTPLVKAHNLYIDTVRGLAFTAGGDANVNRGGVLIFDLNADPAHPPLVAQGPAVYAHDVYVQGDLMYTSEIYGGQLGIYNVADLDDISKVGATTTPFAFTHNAWTNEGGTTVFTTDERANASVAAYSISNPGDIRLLDQYRPLTSLNSNTIPHNVHVIDDYLSISYYTDGLRVVDASVPGNLVEVANFDTYAGPDGGFSGAWGAYPFLPSGLTLVSDRQSGLFVVDVDYKRAARLTGMVRIADSGNPISDASVELLNAQASRVTTTAVGSYATGVADGGTYLAEVYAEGYLTDTFEVNLVNGNTVIQNFTLSPAPIGDVEVVLASAVSRQPILGGILELTHQDRSFVTISDENGTARVEDIYDYDYRATVTVWGYLYYELPGLRGSELTGGDTLFLEPGYQDYFNTDLGWTITGDAERGLWERGVPTATFGFFGAGQPGNDSPRDRGDQAYVTDLRGGAGLAYDVDGNATILNSPPIDLTGYGELSYLSYDYWYTNSSGGFRVNDSMTVSLATPTDTVTLAVYSTAMPAWTRDTIMLGGRIPFGDSLRLLVSVGDSLDSDNLVEAAFDNFLVVDSMVINAVAGNPDKPQVRVEAFPNPTGDAFNLTYDLGRYAEVKMDVYSLTGQRILQREITGNRGNFRIGADWQPGVYLLRLSTPAGRPLNVLKLVKF